MQDSIVESVREQYLNRSKTGINKYGVTLDRTDLSTIQWLEHAKEEAMDLALYLEKIIQELKKSQSIPNGFSQAFTNQTECIIHSTDWNGKCFTCGKQVFVREPKEQDLKGFPNPTLPYVEIKGKI